MRTDNRFRSVMFHVGHVGDLAYFDSFAGLIPCKVIAVDTPPSLTHDLGTRVTVKVTADRSAVGFKRGEEITTECAHRVVPRCRVHTRGGIQRISGGYGWSILSAGDTPAQPATCPGCGETRLILREGVCWDCECSHLPTSANTAERTMETYFETYFEAHAVAQERASRLKIDVGLEKWSSPLTPGMRFRLFLLPAEKQRQGFETRCEVVRPTGTTPCRECGRSATWVCEAGYCSRCQM